MYVYGVGELPQRTFGATVAKHFAWEGLRSARERLYLGKQWLPQLFVFSVLSTFDATRWVVDPSPTRSSGLCPHGDGYNFGHALELAQVE